MRASLQVLASTITRLPALQGCFYEGYMATGNASDATDAAIQENIIAVGYSGWTPAVVY